MDDTLENKETACTTDSFQAQPLPNKHFPTNKCFLHNKFYQ